MFALRQDEPTALSEFAPNRPLRELATEDILRPEAHASLACHPKRLAKDGDIPTRMIRTVDHPGTLALRNIRIRELQ